MPAELCIKIISESTAEKKDAIEALEKLTDARQAYYEAGYAIHELAMHAEAIYRSPKAVTEEQRLLLSYAFSNLTLNASKITPNYTLGFQFLQEWMPMVNKIFKPAENVATAGTFEPSEEEKASLYHHRDLNPSSRRERAVSWTRLDDDGVLPLRHCRRDYKDKLPRGQAGLAKKEQVRHY